MAEDEEKKRKKRDYWPLVLAALASLRIGRGAIQNERDTPLDELANVIFALNAAAYEEALRQTVAVAGGDPAQVTLSNREVIARLRRQAEESARSIVDTYEADLERMLAAMPADVEPHDIPGLIEQWSAERARWKVLQIARTETSHAVGQAQRDFAVITGRKGLAWFGGSLRCKLCQQWAGENPYELTDPEYGNHPHVACLDHWEVEWIAGDGMWLGE